MALDEAVLRQARILIVDDEKVSVRLLERMLRTGGWTNVKSTFDPRDVRRLIADFQPDLIMLDLHMPHADGLELLAELRPRGANGVAIPILMVTADNSPEVKEAALAAGAVDFLAKPIELTDLIPRVRTVLEARLQRRREERPQPAGTGRKERIPGVNTILAETLERLALVAEYRDDLTQGEHVRRVGQTSARIARLLRLPERQVEMIRLSAPLHDLGKIAIPERILLKPGPLLPDEFEAMKTHTTAGAAMLAGSAHPVLQMAQRIALSHHERWDGGGFPQGLHGEAIPLEARIVAVADAFDAMNSDRPYRRALSAEEVWNILVDGAGRQWDLTVVDALASLMRVDVQMDRPFDLTAFLEEERIALDPRR